MRIHYITHNFPPEPGATKRPLKQARVLRALGHDVTIITSFPHYPYGTVFPGYAGRLWMRETVEGVDVIRIWSVIAANRGIAKRVLASVTFMLAAIVTSLLLRRPDVVLSCAAPPLCEMAGKISALFRGALLVLEVRDLMPEGFAMTRVPLDGPIGRMLRKYYDFMYRHADILALAEEHHQTALQGRVRGPAFVPLRHAVDFDQMQADTRPSRRNEFGIEECFVMVYCGSFAPIYRIPDLVEAAPLLAAELPRARFLLVGAGPELDVVKDRVAALDLDNVILAGGVPPDDVLSYLRTADLFIHPQHLKQVTEGTKIAEYLALGRPILNLCHAAGADGQAEALGIGLSVPPGDARALADAILRYAGDPLESAQTGARSKALAEAQFDRREIVGRFEKTMLDIWTRRRPQRSSA